jgi:3-methyladenine DNA glycosylase AlkD
MGRRERAEGEKRYLKSDFDFLGVTTPDLRRQTKAWLRSHPDLTPIELRQIARALFARRTHELKALAILLLQYRLDRLEPADLEMLEQMLRRSYTWAYVDALAVHVVGAIVDRYPETISSMDAWAKDPDFWIRRSALLSLLLPLRRGNGDWNRFVLYADSMLEEREFFIRKAIGWILREVSKTSPERVSTFLESRVARISGVTFREAIKYLADEDRDRLKTEYYAHNRGGRYSR